MPERCTWTIVRVAEEIPLPKQHEMRALFRWFSCFGLHIGCAHPVRGRGISRCAQVCMRCYWGGICASIRIGLLFRYEAVLMHGGLVARGYSHAGVHIADSPSTYVRSAHAILLFYRSCAAVKMSYSTQATREVHPRATPPHYTQYTHTHAHTHACAHLQRSCQNVLQVFRGI